MAQGIIARSLHGSDFRFASCKTIHSLWSAPTIPGDHVLCRSRELWLTSQIHRLLDRDVAHQRRANLRDSSCFILVSAFRMVPTRMWLK
jgi:hypothetical protein